jgi:ubiquitin carboxyl-terminal hydrolase 36/42
VTPPTSQRVVVDEGDVVCFHRRKKLASPSPCLQDANIGSKSRTIGSPVPIARSIAQESKFAQRTPVVTPFKVATSPSNPLIRLPPTMVPQQGNSPLAPSFSVHRCSPPGLSNLGNTCYLNATLQCLLSVHEFVEEVKRLGSMVYAQQDDVSSRDTFSVICSFYHLVQNRDNVLDPRHPNRRSMVDTRDIQSSLEKHCPSVFAGGNQQDAHECFVRILEALESESKSLDSHYKCPFAFSVHVGMMCCACGHETSMKEESNVNIGLDMPERDENLLDNLITDYFADEIVEKNCESCGKKDVKHSLRRSLLTLPQCLVLHAKRFVFNPCSLRNPAIPVFIKNRSSIKSFTVIQQSSLHMQSEAKNDQNDKPCDKQGEKTMTLSCMIHHSGSRIESGHYIADIRVDADRWFRCNDSIVQSIASPEDGQGSHDCYMMFYRP